jgi:photosystem II stability/assembly factor-like uncharacterized protein
MKPWSLFFFISLVLLSCRKDQPEQIPFLKIETGVNGNLNALCLLNDSSLIAGGEHHGEGIVILSKNAGYDWELLPGRTEGAVTALLVVDSVTWYAGTSAPHAYKTTNAGLTWEKLWVNTPYAPNYRKPVRSIVQSEDSSVYFVLGGDFEAGGIWKTYDGGNRWKAHTFNFELRDLAFENAETGYACGFGNMIQTKDGGETWTYSPCSNAYFTKLNFDANKKWWSVSFNGGVYHSADPASGWREMRPPAKVFSGRKNFTGFIWDGDRPVLYGENGWLITGNSTGSNWEEAACCNEATLRNLVVSVGHYIACGKNGEVYLIERN